MRVGDTTWWERTFTEEDVRLLVSFLVTRVFTMSSQMSRDA